MSKGQMTQSKIPTQTTNAEQAPPTRNCLICDQAEMQGILQDIRNDAGYSASYRSLLLSGCGDIDINQVNAAVGEHWQPRSLYVATKNKRFQTLYLSNALEERSPPLNYLDNIIIVLVGDSPLIINDLDGMPEFKACLKVADQEGKVFYDLDGLQNHAKSYFTAQEKNRFFYRFWAGVTRLFQSFIRLFNPHAGRQIHIPVIRSRALQQLKEVIRQNQDEAPTLTENFWAAEQANSAALESYHQCLMNEVRVISSAEAKDYDLLKFQALLADFASSDTTHASVRWLAKSCMHPGIIQERDTQETQWVRDLLNEHNDIKKFTTFIKVFNQAVQERCESSDSGQPYLIEDAQNPRHIIGMHALLKVISENIHELEYVGGMEPDGWQDLKNIYGSLIVDKAFPLLVHPGLFLEASDLPHDSNQTVPRGLMMHDFILSKEQKGEIESCYNELCTAVCVKDDPLTILRCFDEKKAHLTKTLGACAKMVWYSRINTCHADYGLPFVHVLLQSARNKSGVFSCLGWHFTFKAAKYIAEKTPYEWVLEHEADEGISDLRKQMESVNTLPSWKHSVFYKIHEDRALERYGRLSVVKLKDMSARQLMDPREYNHAREHYPPEDREQAPGF